MRWWTFTLHARLTVSVFWEVSIWGRAILSTWNIRFGLNTHSGPTSGSWGTLWRLHLQMWEMHLSQNTSNLNFVAFICQGSSFDIDLKTCWCVSGLHVCMYLWAVAYASNDLNLTANLEFSLEQTWFITKVWVSNRHFTSPDVKRSSLRGF